MITRLVGTHELVAALIEEGFELPKECVDIELLVPIDGLFRARYTVNLTADDIDKMGLAMIRVAKN